jgi:hypothetical protein
MDKANASSRQKRQYYFPLLAAALCFMLSSSALQAITLSQADAQQIGRKIWQNECNGTVSGLTSWNADEDFASLGIGHFIWYPQGKRGPFEESFPKLIKFVASRGAKLPQLLLGAGEAHCPWTSRSEFIQAQETVEMKQLRQFLVDTVDLQTQFLVDRLQQALPKMLEEAAPANRANVQQQFERVANSPQGSYALVDYVNFKGEGVLHSERYRGQGWGLLQVLEEMRLTPDPVREFSQAAAMVLTRRVQNAPPARNEARWLPGWIQRVSTYRDG